MPATEQPVRGKSSETFHLLVDGGQQFLQNCFQLFLGCVDQLIAKAADSVIDAAQRHRKRARERLCTICCLIFSQRYDTLHTVGHPNMEAVKTTKTVEDVPSTPKPFRRACFCFGGLLVAIPG